MSNNERKNSSTSLTERAGVNAVESIFINDFDWFFREQPISDWGVDAHVEVRVDSQPTGKLIALQIKTGASYFRKRKKDQSYVFYGKLRHLKYWENHSLPVFIILHNPESALTIWQKVDRRYVDIKGDRWSISIPETNTLTKDALPYISAGISFDPEDIRRFYFSIDRDLMTKIQDETVYFVIDEWMNKTLGIREVKVYFNDYDKDDPDFVITQYAPTHDIHKFMSELFPWIDYEYASSIQEYSSEIAEHILEVQLSEAALAFLTVEEFFRSGRPARLPPEAPESDDDGEWTDDDLDEFLYRRALEKD